MRKRTCLAGAGLMLAAGLVLAIDDAANAPRIKTHTFSVLWKEKQLVGGFTVEDEGVVKYGGSTNAATAPDGSGTAANGWITTGGEELDEIMAEVQYKLVTGADGELTITLNDDGDATFYLNAEINGAIWASDALSFLEP